MFPGRLPRGQQVITSHLLFRIIPQHVAVLQPRIGSLLRERQISYRIRGFGRRSVLGGLLRASSAAICPLSIVASTVRQCWPCRSVEDVETGCSLTIGLPTFLRFARFRAIGTLLSLIGFYDCRETAQTAKAWPSFPLPSSAVALFQYLRQSTSRTCSLDLSPQSITLRRATLG